MFIINIYWLYQKKQTKHIIHTFTQIRISYYIIYQFKSIISPELGRSEYPTTYQSIANPPQNSEIVSKVIIYLSNLVYININHVPCIINIRRLYWIISTDKTVKLKIPSIPVRY